MAATLYDTLGAAPHDTYEQLRRAYRRASKASHPDRQPGREDQFRAVQSAWEILRDADKRGAYDAQLNPPEEREAAPHRPQPPPHSPPTAATPPPGGDPPPPNPPSGYRTSNPPDFLSTHATGLLAMVLGVMVITGTLGAAVVISVAGRTGIGVAVAYLLLSAAILWKPSIGTAEVRGRRARHPRQVLSLVTWGGWSVCGAWGVVAVVGVLDGRPVGPPLLFALLFGLYTASLVAGWHLRGSAGTTQATS